MGTNHGGGESEMKQGGGGSGMGGGGGIWGIPSPVLSILFTMSVAHYQRTLGSLHRP